MGFINLVFYSFAGLLVVAALGVITARNPVHSVLFLVLSFFATSGLWILLQAEFLAIAMVLVYVGAVMVLFLFVVMMLDINLARMRQGFVRYLPFGVVVALLMVGLMVWVVGDFGAKVFDRESLQQAVSYPADYSNTKALGRVLYTEYVLPFEIASIILLVAIVAAIALTLRRRPMTKHQSPAEQIKVRRNDRLRIIKMDSESKD